MAVMNFICENCNKHRVCAIVSKITVFDDDAKKPLGLNITIDSCQEYEVEN